MLNSQIQSARQNVKRNAEYPGVLGDGNGNPYARRSRYWVRFPLGTDSNGQIVYSAPRAVRYSGESQLLAREGTEVLVRVDPYDGVETITRHVPDYADRADFDSRVLNTSEPITHWWDAKNFIRLLTRPVGGGTAQVTIRENPFHVDDFMDISSFGGTPPDDQLNLAGSIPSSGNHAIAVIFFDWIANAPVAKISTAQGLGTAFDVTDYQECVAQLPHNEHTLLAAIELADGATTLSQLDMVEELRTWLPTPRVYGMPNPIPEGKSFIIRETHQQIVFNPVIEGNLTIEGEYVAL